MTVPRPGPQASSPVAYGRGSPRAAAAWDEVFGFLGVVDRLEKSLETAAESPESCGEASAAREVAAAAALRLHALSPGSRGQSGGVHATPERAQAGRLNLRWDELAELVEDPAPAQGQERPNEGANQGGFASPKASPAGSSRLVPVDVSCDDLTDASEADIWATRGMAHELHQLMSTEREDRERHGTLLHQRVGHLESVVARTSLVCGQLSKGLEAVQDWGHGVVAGAEDVAGTRESLEQRLDALETASAAALAPLVNELDARLGLEACAREALDARLGLEACAREKLGLEVQTKLARLEAALERHAPVAGLRAGDLPPSGEAGAALLAFEGRLLALERQVESAPRGPVLRESPEGQPADRTGAEPHAPGPEDRLDAILGVVAETTAESWAQDQCGTGIPTQRMADLERGLLGLARQLQDLEESLPREAQGSRSENEAVDRRLAELEGALAGLARPASPTNGELAAAQTLIYKGSDEVWDGTQRSLALDATRKSQSAGFAAGGAPTEAASQLEERMAHLEQSSQESRRLQNDSIDRAQQGISDLHERCQVEQAARERCVSMLSQRLRKVEQGPPGQEAPIASGAGGKDSRQVQAQLTALQEGLEAQLDLLREEVGDRLAETGQLAGDAWAQRTRDLERRVDDAVDAHLSSARVSQEKLGILCELIWGEAALGQIALRAEARPLEQRLRSVEEGAAAGAASGDTGCVGALQGKLDPAESASVKRRLDDLEDQLGIVDVAALARRLDLLGEGNESLLRRVEAVETCGSPASRPSRPGSPQARSVHLAAQPCQADSAEAPLGSPETASVARRLDELESHASLIDASLVERLARRLEQLEAKPGDLTAGLDVCGPVEVSCRLDELEAQLGTLSLNALALTRERLDHIESQSPKAGKSDTAALARRMDWLEKKLDRDDLEVSVQSALRRLDSLEVQPGDGPQPGGAAVAAALEHRLGSVESQLSAGESRMDGLELQLQNVDPAALARMDTLETWLGDLAGDLGADGALVQRLDDLETKLGKQDSLKEDAKMSHLLSHRLDGLEDQLGDFDAVLTRRLDKLESQAGPVDAATLLRRLDGLEQKFGGEDGLDVSVLSFLRRLRGLEDRLGELDAAALARRVDLVESQMESQWIKGSGPSAFSWADGEALTRRVEGLDVQLRDGDPAKLARRLERLETKLGEADGAVLTHRLDGLEDQLSLVDTAGLAHCLDVLSVRIEAVDESLGDRLGSLEAQIGRAAALLVDSAALARRVDSVEVKLSDDDDALAVRRRLDGVEARLGESEAEASRTARLGQLDERLGRLEEAVAAVELAAARPGQAESAEARLLECERIAREASDCSARALAGGHELLAAEMRAEMQAALSGEQKSSALLRERLQVAEKRLEAVLATFVLGVPTARSLGATRRTLASVEDDASAPGGPLLEAL